MIDYDFDSHGQVIIKGEKIPHSDFNEILSKYFDGFCPVCNTKLPAGDEIICDECFEKAQSAREPK